MPGFNLRLSDEQHDQIRQEAFARHTSIQKVLIERCFGAETERGSAARAAVVAPGLLNDGLTTRPRSASARKPRKEMCEHRVPAGSFCKACDQ